MFPIVKKLLIFVVLILFCFQYGCSSNGKLVKISPEDTSLYPIAGCLPSEIKPEKQTVMEAVGNGTFRTLTLAEKLVNLGAVCQDGKLVDGSGKEIRFFWYEGCGGMGGPQDPTGAGRKKKELELQELQSKYTVVITTNPVDCE
jgi:hypothetical protein